MTTETTRVIVLADRQQTALEWCRRNGVAPFARSTILATRGPRLRGLTLRPSDRVVDLGGASSEVYEDLSILRYIANIMATAPGEVTR